MTSACPHHWLIEPANGPTSKGVCKLCRERREFQNSVPAEPTWPIRRMEVAEWQMLVAPRR